MSTYYGKNLKLTIYGGSHDAEIGIRATGLPKGIKIDPDELNSFMARRAPGKDSFSTPRKEADQPIFLSGVDESFVTTGDELHAVIRNTNQKSSDYSNLSFIPRPSHADFAARMKYGENVDLRGGGHFSGRLTAPLCILGAICLQYLRSRGIEVLSHLYSIGTAKDTPFDAAKVGIREKEYLSSVTDFPTLDPSAALLMKNEILSAREEGDSVGGVVECAVIGIPAGLGEHMFNGVENRISGIVFGIPAVKGIEFGAGFSASEKRGSENNDGFYTDGKNIFTKTNNAGGILGGMTTGMPIIFRTAFKPTPSIFKEQDSVDMVSMENVKLNIKGRHDPCVVLRATPVVEAAAAIAVTDMLFDN